MAEHEENNMNRDQRRHEGGKLIEKKIHEYEKQCDKKYEGIHGIVAAMNNIIPFRKMLVSDDGYLIPVEDKFFLVNPETFGFMYGEEIKCIGMITNIIGEATDLDDELNIFATLQFSVNSY
ncbi:MAG: hypothetical protein K6G27_02195 [Lachnospiraceae bacterium]|nr:hypothetical protein [Lachnospiraceae bacterium]